MAMGQLVKCLMEDILHHLGCINLVNNGINYLSTGAGFLPSTAVPNLPICSVTHQPNPPFRSWGRGIAQGLRVAFFRGEML